MLSQPYNQKESYNGQVEARASLEEWKACIVFAKERGYVTLDSLVRGDLSL